MFRKLSCFLQDFLVLYDLKAETTLVFMLI